MKTKAEKGDAVRVYKQDGGHWFDGTIADFLASGNVIVLDEDAEPIEVNPNKNKIELSE